MKLNDDLKKELAEAIKARAAESFETTTSGGLKHFISSEGQSSGLYIGTIQIEEKDYKIYMI